MGYRYRTEGGVADGSLRHSPLLRLIEDEATQQRPRAGSRQEGCDRVVRHWPGFVVVPAGVVRTSVPELEVCCWLVGTFERVRAQGSPSVNMPINIAFAEGRSFQKC